MGNLMHLLGCKGYLLVQLFKLILKYFILMTDVQIIQIFHQGFHML